MAPDIGAGAFRKSVKQPLIESKRKTTVSASSIVQIYSRTVASTSPLLFFSSQDRGALQAKIDHSANSVLHGTAFNGFKFFFYSRQA
jgi:hypothetical protein